jgi:hypothetical protein
MLYLSCPRCGLTVLPSADWLTVDHCPRCLARRRARVPMAASPAPGEGRASAPEILGPTARSHVADGEV